MTPKPGRELDALVAEKVMGFCDECRDLSRRHIKNDPEVLRIIKEECRYNAVVYISDEDDLDEDGQRYWLCGRHDKRMDAQVRPYSTDIAAAWEVVEKMQADKWYWAVDYDYGELVAGFYRGRDHEGELEGHFEQADTAPLAICLAALKAVEVTE